MINIEEHMNQWGLWAPENSNADFAEISRRLSGFVSLPRNKQHKKCTYSNDMLKLIDMAIMKLKDNNEFQIIVLRYVYGLSKRKISRMLGVTEGLVRYELKMAESFISGLLFYNDHRFAIMDIRVNEKRKIQLRY